jgi:hypothetical protein
MFQTLQRLEVRTRLDEASRLGTSTLSEPLTTPWPGSWTGHTLHTDFLLRFMAFLLSQIGHAEST